MSEPINKYEYFFEFWGQAENVIASELGTENKKFWFDTKEDVETFKTKVCNIAKKHKQTIVSNIYEGTNVRYETIAKMVMVLPNGKKYPFEYNFGFAYPEESAEFMFFDGNYCCDCNRSSFLSKQYSEISEMECGYTIQIEDFKVVFQKQLN